MCVYYRLAWKCCRVVRLLILLFQKVSIAVVVLSDDFWVLEDVHFCWVFNSYCTFEVSSAICMSGALDSFYHLINTWVVHYVLATNCHLYLHQMWTVIFTILFSYFFLFNVILDSKQTQCYKMVHTAVQSQ